METIKYFLRKKNTCAMAIIMFYENIGFKKVHRVLSCVVYSLIENYVLLTIYRVNQKP